MAQPGGGLSAPSDQPSAAEILAALPAAMLVIDAGEHIRDANAAAEAVLNHSLASMQGRALGDVLILPMIYARDADAVLALYDVPLMTARGLRFRADFFVTPLPEHPGWRLILLHQTAAAHRMGQGSERGAARAAVGAAAMLAHEIKNPLSGIRGAAQLLGSDLDGEQRAMTELIRTEVDRIAALIDRMEGFTDDRPLVCEPQNIHAILDHAAALAGQGADGLTIIPDYDPSLPPVLAHRDSLVQVLLNLLNNASEATQGKGKIVLKTAYRHGVSVEAESGKRRLPIELSVIDDGPGAPPEIAEHLFEPFVTGKRSGRGLGLALVDKLVRDMGGMVQYSREGDPERTVFRLLLPRAEERG